jgi:hypothetical protein
LITVRTYPVPARKGVEFSCTAGITDQGKWIRLFPVPYRFLEEDQRFKKYQWIEVETTKSTNDLRPESHKLRSETIQVGKTISPDHEWRERRTILKPLMSFSLCGLQKEREHNGFPSLGIIKPAKISRLVIEKTGSTWTESELSILGQLDLFQKAPKETLEKLPFVFKYDFKCSEPSCGGHSCTCTDWELGQSYRKWRREYGGEWEQAFRQRYETEMIDKFDTHFFVGNLHQYPNAWIIIGLFYPPKQTTGDLFG